jgi:hypothetical protein
VLNVAEKKSVPIQRTSWCKPVKCCQILSTDEVIKGQAKIVGQQMSGTTFVHRNLHVFCSKKSDYSEDE